MADHTIILHRNRDQAHRIIAAAPQGSVVTVSAPKRTLSQNDRMWALLTDISVAKPEGRCLTPDIWKVMFMHSLDHAQRFEMALDGRGMVPVGFRSSKLSKAEMGDLMEFISEYGARHGVRFHDEREAA